MGRAPQSQGRDRFVFARWLFVRLLGLCYLIAFLSLLVQIKGLLGAQGILPASEYLSAVAQRFDVRRFYLVPTVFWLGASDIGLQLVCALGALFSVVLIAGRFERAALIALWILYLSMCSVGRSFLAFQWDILLLEVGFLALLLPLERGGQSGARWGRAPNRASLLLLRLLLFKLVFSSGLVKLSSGDETWRNLTALVYHYETQPLPTWLGWYAHQLPGVVHRLSVAVTLFIQLVVPFLIWAPRRARHAAVLLLIGLQLLIALTGNYTYFNLLTVALCLLNFDDEAWSKVLPGRWREGASRVFKSGAQQPSRRMTWPLVALLVALNGLVLTRTAGVEGSRAGDELLDFFRPFRSVNSYGLFASMTTSRVEIVIEGSRDGARWSAYEFPHKPGALSRAPSFVAPYQPRLDWQMWFAALSHFRNNRWVGVLLYRLLKGQPEVLDLLSHNPFADRPPKWIRARVFHYRFTDPQTRQKTGRWWQRTAVGSYVRAFSLDAIPR